MPELRDILLDHVNEDAGQPREQFDPDDMKELVAGIREHGIIQPLQVRRVGATYILIDGGRRYRAAVELGLQTLPCLVYEGVTSLLHVRQMQVMSNASRAPLTALEDAQSLWIIWLIRQAEALANEGGDSQILQDLLQDGDGPMMQMQVLEDHLCVALGVDSIKQYVTSGKVRVSWGDVLAGIGRSDWNQARRVRHLAPLKLSREVQQDLLGEEVSAHTLGKLAQHSPEDQQRIVSEAKQATKEQPGQLGRAIRDAMGDDEGLLDPDAPTKRGDANFEPDPQMALLTKGNTAPKLITDQPEPGRGSSPPDGHGMWEPNTALQVSGALEALLQVLRPARGTFASDKQKTAIGDLWQEVSELMRQATAA